MKAHKDGPRFLISAFTALIVAFPLAGAGAQGGSPLDGLRPRAG